ncbi:unnamed protein product [Effrenium voratum]|uniref:Protein kinase domain-containing protein n=1 Tax=Effrenium voratum TaxID=2562239 RepID=A0AA36IUP4_9DINO|nr:unnamed protein product [Effrenium voratum]CAJ1393223.1 unnamed protein product [Effrenium voratum]CAJ1420034.1 unnamed protein product [Effrenium voratum]|mmetsp:Transcript_106019/g.253024  ORF Transcript_106019/g.253024 Transcript_106019/m.253024 type:complete len:351 (+) Transcript_106019:34-1086(+)
MRAARERLGLSLQVSTNDSSREGGKVEHQRRIKATSEGEVIRRYKIGGIVMDSTNRGMEVRWATRLADGHECVVKTRQKGISFKSATEERNWRSTTEVQMSMPKIDKLCEIYEVLETPERYLIFMEKVQGKDLFEQMDEGHLSHIDAREVVRQTLDALRVLHASGRIHKDLKAENVMVDIPSPGTKQAKANMMERLKDGGDAQSPASVKIIDFDTVENWEPSSPKAKDVLGTDGYIAPEAYLGNYSPASDIYSIGVVMYKLLTGRFPSREAIFDDGPGENWVGSPAMKRIHERLKTERIDFTRPPMDKCTEAAELCARMLTFEPMDRPSADEALQHAWFMIESSKLPSRR